jgi:protein disulfide-isomerase
MQGSSFGEQVFWQTDLEAAKRLAAQTNRLVLIHFSAPWCQPCARLEESVFRKPGFSAALDPQYVGVKLNLDDHRKLASQYSVQVIPADIVITPQGEVVQKLQSPPTIESYVGIMQQVATRAGKPPVAVANASQPASAGQTMTSPPGMSPPAMSAPPPAMAVASAGQNSTLSDNRYSDYFAGLRASQAAAGNNPMAAAAPPAQASMPTQPSPPAMPAQASAQSAYSPMQNSTPTMTGSTPAAGPDRSMLASSVTPSAAPPRSTTPPAAASSPASAPATAHAAPPGRTLQLPPGSPPLGMEGYCPVTLVEKQAWKEGDVRFGAIHHGRTYLFANQSEQQRFLANPDAFSPVMSGDDPVLALDENKSVPGKRKHGVFFGNRIYLFSTEATLAAFSKNPGRYAPEITQARR